MEVHEYCIGEGQLYQQHARSGGFEVYAADIFPGLARVSWRANRQVPFAELLGELSSFSRALERSGVSSAEEELLKEGVHLLRYPILPWLDEFGRPIPLYPSLPLERLADPDCLVRAYAAEPFRSLYVSTRHGDFGLDFDGASPAPQAKRVWAASPGDISAQVGEFLLCTSDSFAVPQELEGALKVVFGRAMELRITEPNIRVWFTRT